MEVRDVSYADGTAPGYLPLAGADLSVAVGIDADRHQGVDVDDLAVLADFEHQGVGGGEGVRAGVEWPVPERLDLLVELFRHDADLRFRQ